MSASSTASAAFLGRAYDERHKKLYQFIRLLGRGGFGATYSATRRGDPEDQSWVVKVFQARRKKKGAAAVAAEPPEERPFDPTYVEQEYLVSEVIRERLPGTFCKDYVVCAHRRFYNAAKTRGYIIFPYVEAVTLEVWLRSVLYAAMRDYRDELRTAAAYDGYLSGPTLLQERQRLVTELKYAPEDEAIVFEGLLKRFDERYGAVLESLAQIQGTAMAMAYKLINAVADLHSKNIFHRDLKPINILVQGAQPRIIDFGLACVIADKRPNTVSDDVIIGCPDYSSAGTPNYTDPLSVYRYPDASPRTIATYTARFDTYSLGKVIQRLFDDRLEKSRFPIVRETQFMPPGLAALLVDMTGENQYQPPPDAPDDYRLPRRETIQRFASFDRRPTMNQVAQRFARVFALWDKAIDVGYSTPAASVEASETGSSNGNSGSGNTAVSSKDELDSQRRELVELADRRVRSE